MSASCCAPPAPSVDPTYRRVLWIALVANAIMFAVEVITGASSSSASLLADAIDFFGDAANYALSLAVLSMALPVRSKAAIFKSACMALFGVLVLARAVWTMTTGVVPEATTMGVVAIAALTVNAFVATLLYRYRAGDANMRSVWICTRNDAIGNVAVGLAAIGVFGTGSAWPDVAVAAAMAMMALTGAYGVMRLARLELASASGTTIT